MSRQRRRARSKLSPVSSASPTGAYLMIAKNKNGNNLAVPESYAELTNTIQIGAVEPGASQQFHATVTLTPDRGVFSITAMIRGNDFEVNHGNDDVTRYFVAPKLGHTSDEASDD